MSARGRALDDAVAPTWQRRAGRSARVKAPGEHEPEEHEQRRDQDERTDPEPYEKRDQSGALRGGLLDRHPGEEVGLCAAPHPATMAATATAAV